MHLKERHNTLLLKKTWKSCKIPIFLEPVWSCTTLPNSCIHNQSIYFKYFKQICEFTHIFSKLITCMYINRSLFIRRLIKKKPSDRLHIGFTRISHIPDLHRCTFKSIVSAYKIFFVIRQWITMERKQIHITTTDIKIFVHTKNILNFNIILILIDYTLFFSLLILKKIILKNCSLLFQSSRLSSLVSTRRLQK